MTDIEMALRVVLDSCHCPQPTEPTPCDGWLQHRRCDALAGALAAVVQGMVEEKDSEQAKQLIARQIWIDKYAEQTDVALRQRDEAVATLAEQAREIAHLAMIHHDVTADANLSLQQITRLEEEIDKGKAWLLAHAAEWNHASGSPIDMLLLVLHGRQQEIERLREALKEIEGKLLYSEPMLCARCFDAHGAGDCECRPTCDTRSNNHTAALVLVHAALRATPEAGE
jgi:hypothetical protein